MSGALFLFNHKCQFRIDQKRCWVCYAFIVNKGRFEGIQDDRSRIRDMSVKSIGYKQNRRFENGLTIDVTGITLQLFIADFVPREYLNEDNEWCAVSVIASMGDRVLYSQDNAELLQGSDVERLYQNASAYLGGDMKEKTDLDFIEPELRLVFNPVFDEGGSLNTESFVEIRMYYDSLEGEAGENFLSLCLEKEHVVKLRNYLASVMKGRHENIL